MFQIYRLRSFQAMNYFFSSLVKSKISIGQPGTNLTLYPTIFILYSNKKREYYKKGVLKMMKRLYLLLALTSLLMFLPPIIQAQTKSRFIPAYAFLPRDGDPTWGFESGYMYLKDTSIVGAAAAAPVRLPDGAIITKVVMRYWDNGDADLQMQLWRRNMYTDEEQQLTVFGTDGSEALWRLDEEDNIWGPRISNSGYSYYLFVNFTGKGLDYRLAGVKIIYLE